MQFAVQLLSRRRLAGVSVVVVGESLREDDPAVAARRAAVSSGVHGRGGPGVVRWPVRG